MSKKPKPEQKPEEKPPQEPKQRVIDMPKDSSGKRIEAERFCPICWGRFKGYGTATNSSFMGKRYYKCDKTLPGSEFGPCGYTWSMEWAEIEQARAAFIAHMQSIVVEFQAVHVTSTR